MSERERTKRRMKGLVASWRRSGMPLSVFARANGVTRDQLEYWKRRGDGPGIDAAPAFHPVQVLGDSADPVVAVEVMLASGDRVAVNANASAALVSAVLGALRSRC